MRVFMSAFDKFSLAIPIASVSSIMICNEALKQPNESIIKDSEGNNTYISLPHLFNLPQILIHHGVILKSGNNDDDDTNGDIIKNRDILLTTQIICEIDIPQDKIYPFPKTMKNMDYLMFFSGLIFNSNIQNVNPVSDPETERLTLLLDTKLLVKKITKETI